MRPGSARTFKLALIVAVGGIAVVGVLASRLRSPVRTPVLGAIAGLGYGVLAVAARVLPGFTPGELVRDPAAYALAAAGIVSFMLYATALEGGSVTVATAAVVLVETIPPAIVGVCSLAITPARGSPVSPCWVHPRRGLRGGTGPVRPDRRAQNGGRQRGPMQTTDGEPSTSTVM